MGFLVQWDKEQVQSQTLCTSTFFTVTVPESFVKLKGKAGDVSNNFMYCEENKQK